MIELQGMIGTFALSSGICCHLLARAHHGAEDPWYYNKWFWAGFFGNIPVLIALIAHIYLSRANRKD